jgi:hypothetical protein
MAGLELQGGRSTQSTATPDVAPKATFLYVEPDIPTEYTADHKLKL